MKYLIVTLLISLLGVSTARAVSLSWSSTALAAGTTTEINFTAGTNFSVALVFSANDAASNAMTKLLAISNKAKDGANEPYAQGGVALDIRTNGDIYGRQFSDNSSYKSSTSLNFSTLQSSNVLGITVAFTVNATDASKYDVTYTIYNDEQIYTTTHSKVNNTIDDFKYVRTGIHNATFYYATGTADGDEFASLPEPTALALLALGVAGVALRRKLA